MTEPSAAYDLVVQNGIVVTMNERQEILDPGYVAVLGDTIVEVGSGEGPSRHRTVVDAQGGIVLPGLINAHTHAAMSIFRGLADDLPLMAWLERYIFPVERNLTAEWVYWGTRLAAIEMVRSGTTCFCDMYLFEEQVAQAAHDTGIRALVGEVLYDFDSPSYGKIHNGFRTTRDLAERWRHHPLVSVAVEPHSAYTCSPDLLRRAHGLARDLDLPLAIHVSESEAEVGTVYERYGKRPVEHLADLGVLDSSVIAFHCVALTDRDMDLLAERDVGVCHNVESNMKLASGVAPVPDLLRRGVRLSLGTDGCASNNNLNMFEEMDMSAKVHKVFTKDPTVMSAETVLSLATRGGAEVLGMGHLIGSLDPGKKADLIVLDCNRAHMIPLYNPCSHLVYTANGSEVVTSIINGRLVLAEDRMTTVDEEETYRRVREIAGRVAGLVER